MKIRSDYAQIAVLITRDRDGREHNQTLIGTSKLIAEQVAATLETALDYGETRMIQLVPTSPSSVFRLNEGEV